MAASTWARPGKGSSSRPPMCCRGTITWPAIDGPLITATSVSSVTVAPASHGPTLSAVPERATAQASHRSASVECWSARGGEPTSCCTPSSLNGRTAGDVSGARGVRWCILLPRITVRALVLRMSTQPNSSSHRAAPVPWAPRPARGSSALTGLLVVRGCGCDAQAEADEREDSDRHLAPSGGAVVTSDLSAGSLAASAEPATLTQVPDLHPIGLVDGGGGLIAPESTSGGPAAPPAALRPQAGQRAPGPASRPRHPRRGRNVGRRGHPRDAWRDDEP